MALSPQDQLAQPTSNEGDISLVDILRFLKHSHKTILIFGALGAIAAIAYLLIAPKLYQATATIAMAQIAVANNNNLSPLGINIEEPALLMARLSIPTSFNLQTTTACRLENSQDASSLLAKRVKFALPKGVGNALELSTFDNSPDAAINCAKAVFELIKTTQEQIGTPLIEEAKSKLANDTLRLAAAKELVVKVDKSGAASSAVAYLSTMDEIRFLLDEISTLQNIVVSNQNRATRLIAPIYASDMPIAPKKLIALLAGLLGGLFLGLAFALVRQILTKLKSQVHGVL